MCTFHIYSLYILSLCTDGQYIEIVLVFVAVCARVLKKKQEKHFRFNGKTYLIMVCIKADKNGKFNETFVLWKSFMRVCVCVFVCVCVPRWLTLMENWWKQKKFWKIFFVPLKMATALCRCYILPAIVCRHWIGYIGDIDQSCGPLFYYMSLPLVCMR